MNLFHSFLRYSADLMDLTLDQILSDPNRFQLHKRDGHLDFVNVVE
jgi:hypothetical protein